MSDEMMTLRATTRESGTKGAARRVRAGGQIPGVVYGHGVDNVAVAVDPKEFEECLSTDFGFNVMFHLDVEGGETYQVMVKDYQFHSVRREVTHIDFILVNEDDVMTVPVPVEATGKAVGVVMGGHLDIVTRNIKVRCKISDIPAKIEYDVTDMEIGQSVYIDELEPPEDCEFVYDNRFPVVRVAKKRAPIVEETESAVLEGEEGEVLEGEEGEEGVEGEDGEEAEETAEA